VAILSGLGAQLDVAGNGEDGVSAFLAKDYALIFMDMRMPVMDGLEATRRIRASGKHNAATVPILAMTANVMKSDIEQALDAGMNGHISKPIEFDEAIQTINRLCMESEYKKVI
jgi:CheY-like chemotaxis protein